MNKVKKFLCLFGFFWHDWKLTEYDYSGKDILYFWECVRCGKCNASVMSDSLEDEALL